MRWVVILSAAMSIATTSAQAHEPVLWNGIDYEALLEADQSDLGIGLSQSAPPPDSGPSWYGHDHADDAAFGPNGEDDFRVEGAPILRRPYEAARVPKNR